MKRYDFLTEAYVQQNSVFSEVKNNPHLAQYIKRANMAISYYAEYNDSAAEFEADFTDAALLYLENLVILSIPRAQRAKVLGITSETEGSYSYAMGRATFTDAKSIIENSVDILLFLRPYIVSRTATLDCSNTQDPDLFGSYYEHELRPPRHRRGGGTI